MKNLFFSFLLTFALSTVAFRFPTQIPKRSKVIFSKNSQIVEDKYYKFKKCKSISKFSWKNAFIGAPLAFLFLNGLYVTPSDAALTSKASSVANLKVLLQTDVSNQEVSKDTSTPTVSSSPPKSAKEPSKNSYTSSVASKTNTVPPSTKVKTKNDSNKVQSGKSDNTVKLVEEIAMEGAIEKKKAGVLRQNELLVQNKESSSRISNLKKEIKSLQISVDRVNNKIRDKRIINPTLLADEKSDYLKSINEKSIKLKNLEIQVERNEAELSSLKRRLVSDDTFIKQKKESLKTKKKSIEKAKIEEENKKKKSKVDQLTKTAMFEQSNVNKMAETRNGKIKKVKEIEKQIEKELKKQNDIEKKIGSLKDELMRQSSALKATEKSILLREEETVKMKSEINDFDASVKKKTNYIQKLNDEAKSVVKSVKKLN